MVAHCLHDRVDVVQARIAFGGKSFLQSLPGHAGFCGHVGDPFDAGDDT